MNISHQRLIESTIAELYNDSRNDHLKMMKGRAKSVFRPMQPSDFKDVYLSISQQQGEDLIQLIKANQVKNIVEFGTSFGISTLFLAKGVIENGGSIITTELIKSKAQRAMKNFQKAGVEDFIEVRIGDALQTLKGHNEPIDLLLLDGWKDLYLPLFQMLEPCFHANSLIYVDNADMGDTQAFLKTVSQKGGYQFESSHHGKVVLIRAKN